MSVIIADTGPIVAYLNHRDRWHEWARGVFSMHEPPYLVCEGVLIESGFLLKKGGGSHDALMELLHRGLLKIGFSVQQMQLRIRRTLSRYHDLPASITDACLVCLSEQHHECHVMTTDSDFRVYRRHDRQVIPLIAPPGI
jgi:predicted nucleic acid-binding protein